jgi:hypothetical protein
VNAYEAAKSALLPHLDREAILSVYAAAPGDEISSGKFSNPASSAALAANMFGPGLTTPSLFKASDVWANSAGAAQAVTLEAIVRFAWRGGRHPCLDALLSGPGWLCGVESKRYEPYRSKSAASFSQAFDRPVWTGLQRYDALRRSLQAGDTVFKRLDAAQLIKHTLALGAEAERRDAQATLLYLYAEPTHWPNGAAVDPGAVQSHRNEIKAFDAAVRGDRVAFRAVSYGVLLDTWRRGGGLLGSHAEQICNAFDV